MDTARSGTPETVAPAIAAALAARGDGWPGSESAGARPAIGVVLGSGLHGFTRHIDRARRIPFTALPGLAAATAPGHAGELLLGTVADRDVIVQVGRLHLYEGLSAERVALPIRVLHALGVRSVLISNAAGGIRAGLVAGTLMVVRDHINLTWRNPLLGPVHPGEPRFPDMSAPYDAACAASFRRAASAEGLTVAEGVYAGVLGPSYETPAEIRMLASLGADAVGMSTVPEVLVARALGMRVLAVSCITNRAAGLTADRLDHADVLATGARIGPAFDRAVRAWVAGEP